MCGKIFLQQKPLYFFNTRAKCYPVIFSLEPVFSGISELKGKCTQKLKTTRLGLLDTEQECERELLCLRALDQMWTSTACEYIILGIMDQH